MTDQELRIEIAQIQGWFDIEVSNRGVRGKHEDHHFLDHKGERVYPLCFVPNYCNDLNAIHSVEMSQSFFFYMSYEKVLHDIMGKPHFYPYIRKETHLATARQRAEAFLATKNELDAIDPLTH